MRHRIPLRHGLWLLTIIGFVGCGHLSSTPDAHPDSSWQESKPSVDRMLMDLATLQAEGNAALRDEAQQLAVAGDNEGLRRALVLLTLREDGNDEEATRLLRSHLEHLPPEPPQGRADGWLARFLLDEIDNRRRIEVALTEAIEERDRLRRQVEELMIIENKIRERPQVHEIELEP